MKGQSSTEELLSIRDLSSLSKRFISASLIFFLSFFEGFKQASGLMAMVLFVGGAFGVIKHIGLLEASINALAGKLQNLHFLPMTLTLILSFGTLVSLTGMYELSIVLVPLIVPLYLRFGYDVVVGTAVVLVGACAGLGAGMTNPFFTAIAQNIAELPLYSGILFRLFFVLVPCSGWPGFHLLLC
ncbi:MAG: hypothetical protein MH186_12845 [Marinobacter sp.]|nr:hypothetical protein [Marinobacter sp.]